ncbi:MAG TPA: substrate-binding domain-containing protein [Chitinophagaceae bacterium]|jgi:phosphate transport system substrate-binding protein|nr:substrate-binding domain-containing protein [Chitinophagaceae bacterium]
MSSRTIHCRSLFFIALLGSVLLAGGCRSSAKKGNDLQQDTRTSGTIQVSADESFKPVIDELVQVYESNHPGTHIVVYYKPEADCLRDMLTDSIRMIIATRTYNEEERSLMSDSMAVSPRALTVARDGISVIVHPSATDTSFTMADVKQILTGKYKKNLIPVFDGLKATSTVRFVIDSVLRGDTLTSKAMAARSSEEVMNYVSKTPGAVGFIGVEWIGNPEDTSQQSYLKKIRVAGIESTDIPGGFVKASQANIYIKRYPMVRDLVYILKENYEGLGTGFANFMSDEIGQLIFLRAYLAPSQKRFGVRPVRLKE